MKNHQKRRYFYFLELNVECLGETKLNISLGPVINCLLSWSSLEPRSIFTGSCRHKIKGAQSRKDVWTGERVDSGTWDSRKRDWVVRSFVNLLWELEKVHVLARKWSYLQGKSSMAAHEVYDPSLHWTCHGIIDKYTYQAEPWTLGPVRYCWQ